MAHAQSDLELARIGRANKDILAEQVCFHAQQAAEKAIKAVFLSRKIDFPLTHDLEELIEIADRHKLVLSSDVREAGALTPYAVETRYPGVEQGVSVKEVNAAIQLAEGIIAWAKKQANL
jgi:HEPN domain-containing protein